MKRKIRIAIGIFIISIAAITTYSITASTPDKECATCIGSTPCKACKNCKYCKHCAKNGGTCGTCR